MASQGRDRRLERRLAQQGNPKQDRRNSSPAPFLAIEVGVPLFVGSDVDRDVVRPGGGVDFLGGVDFGYGVLELDVGFLAAPIESSGGVTGVGREPLKHVHFGFGGRLQLLNDSVVTPYLGASFALQWWRLFETPTACPPWYCTDRNGFQFTPGLNLRVGMLINVGDCLALDLGLRYGIAFQGNDVFDKVRHFLAPGLGLRFWLG